MSFRGLVGICVGVWLVLGGHAQAATLTISITNTTGGIFFKELLIVAHGVNDHLFNSGSVTTAGLQALAECGDQGSLATELRTANPLAVVWGVESYPGLNKLRPGDTVSIGPLVVTDATDTRLSVAGRMMATNDGFAGLESVPIPATAGTYTFDMLAFDNGTEANNEIFPITDGPCTVGDRYIGDQRADLPDDPYLGGNGTGTAGHETAVTNTSITVHRGVLGDSYAGGGISDLDSAHHHWTNPVATVTVIVQ